MKIVIKNIEHKEKVSQAGKPWNSCTITVWNKKDNKDTFISGFESGITKTWNIGDTVEVDLEQKDKYWNFKENENSKPSENPVVALLREILLVLKMGQGYPNVTEIIMPKNELDIALEATAPSDNFPPVKEEIKLEDIPF